jgi:ATP-dependent Clp protease ATP-binding subunit ClpA
MFERFTEGARRTVVVAQEEARRLDHNYIGTEHLLAGLMHEHGGIAAQVLGEMGLQLDDVRVEIVRVVGRGRSGAVGQVPFTPNAKKALEHSLAAARSLNMDMIGTEHMLLGLVRSANALAARILLELGAEPEEVRGRVLLALGHPQAIAAQAASARRRLRALDARLSAFDRREEVARIAGEAANPPEAARELSRVLGLDLDQAEAILQIRVSDWTKAESTRLQRERDRLRTELDDQ